LPSPVTDQRRTRRVQVFICCGVLLALAAIALSSLSGPLQTLATFLMLVNGGQQLYRAWPGSRGYLCQLQVTSEGRLLCGFAPEPEVLLPGSVRHWWTVCDRVAGLVVDREHGRSSRAILFRDLLPPDQWRRLNLCLRLGPA
jgi:hypothetical protein